MLVFVNFNGLICYIGVESCWFDGNILVFMFFVDLECVLVFCKDVDFKSSYIVSFYNKGIKWIV